MAEIVNLNRFRKAKERDSEAKQAAENRVRFGRSKVEKANDRREAERRANLHAGKELDKPATGDKSDAGVPDSDRD
ncbi:DUF4169 family protein [Dongia sp.]|uniref:DUF4169 family protein n=1 Tax=Dongia sp. TaxID=1977262 RepID=UPI0035B036A6